MSERDLNMGKKAHDEAERVVGNAFYMHHPYRRGGAGLMEFCRLLLIKKEISNPFLLKTIIPELDKLAESLEECLSCYLKLCYLAALLCRDKLTEHEKRYLMLYEKGQARARLGSSRDYRAEVDEAFQKVQDVNSAQARRSE